MTEHTFTARWEQTPGNPAVTFTWRGFSPTDAIVRQWATCLPDTEMSSPLKCETDGHIYHLRLDEDGMREIRTIALPTQSHIVETI
jgi:hypothetical protein